MEEQEGCHETGGFGDALYLRLIRQNRGSVDHVISTHCIYSIRKVTYTVTATQV